MLKEYWIHWDLMAPFYRKFFQALVNPPETKVSLDMDQN